MNPVAILAEATRWRSLLFVPAHQQRFVARAHERGADGVTLDLEDAVPAEEKQAARGALAASMASVGQGGGAVLVRVNHGLRTLARDLEAATIPGVAALVLPKVESAAWVTEVADAVQELELDSEALRTSYDRLITMDISGYGAGHSYADMKAYDLLIQAETGLAGITGHPAGPGRVGVSVSDIACGMSAYAAVLEALIGRSITGRGRRLEVSLFDGTADWMNVPLLYAEGTGKTPARLGLAHPSICPYGAFVLGDGSLVLVAIQNEREWAHFCDQVLGEPELAVRPGFDSNNARVANRASVDARVGEVLRTLPRAEAEARLRRSRTAYGFVNGLAELGRHPALRRIEVATPGGRASVVAPPAIHDGEAAELGAVPSIGEHSDMIRAQFGLDASDGVLPR